MSNGIWTQIDDKKWITTWSDSAPFSRSVFVAWSAMVRASLQRPWTRMNRSKAGSMRLIFSRKAEQFAAGISRTGMPRSLAKSASVRLLMALDVPKIDNLRAVGGAVVVSARGSLGSNDGRLVWGWRTGILEKIILDNNYLSQYLSFEYLWKNKLS